MLFAIVTVRKTFRLKFKWWYSHVEVVRDFVFSYIFIKLLFWTVIVSCLQVAVEGNIGSGKSTLLKYFESSPNVETIKEPLDKWCNLDGHNVLVRMNVASVDFFGYVKCITNRFRSYWKYTLQFTEMEMV